MLGGATFVTLSMLLLSGKTGAQDFRQLKEQITRQRQIQIIKTHIISHVKTNRLLDPKRQLGGSVYGGIEEQKGGIFPQSTPDNWHSTPVPTQPPAVKTKQRQMVVLGEPSSSERDGCLNFPVARYLNITRKITPVKMDLYVHITKGSRKKSRRSSRNTDRSNRRPKKRRVKKSKRKNKKSKRKRKGKRITLSVSNGSKRLAKLRMRVNQTHWYNIELPISQFPKEISSADTFQLCISCKRCKKKIKLDLYRDKTDNKTFQHIPFIHIQTVSQLPQIRLRSKRSSDVLQNGYRPVQNSDTSVSKCCREQIYTEDMNVPYLLQPTKFNISFCETLQNSDGGVSSTNTLNNLLSKDSSEAIQRKCVSASYESLTYSFLDRDLKVKYASIPNLLPKGCKCVTS